MYKHKWKMTTVFQHLIFLYSSMSPTAGYIVCVPTYFYIHIYKTALLNKIILSIFSLDPWKLAQVLMDST